jgi:c(7)-type cytochrome triheme protein
MKRIILVFCLLLCVLVPSIVFAENVGGGDLTFTPKGSGKVIFSHQTHVVSKGLKCSGCHYHVFQMAKGSYKMDMSKITKGDFCGKCHNGQKSFDVHDNKNCAKCHQ